MGASGLPGVCLYVSSGNKYFWTNTSYDYVLSPLSAVATGTWRRFSMVSDGLLYTMYEDNRVIGGPSNIYPAHPNGLSITKWGVGANWGTYLPGEFADPGIWNRALSASEISALAVPSNVMLSGLILPPRRRLFAVTSGGGTKTGTAACTVAKATAAATDAIVVIGSASCTAKKATATATDAILDTGSAACSARKATAAANGGPIDPGAVACSIRKPTTAATGLAVDPGAAACVARSPTAAATGQTIDAGGASCIASRATAASSGGPIAAGSVACAPPGPTASAAGAVLASGSAVVTARRPIVSIGGNVLLAGPVACAARQPLASATGRVILSGLARCTCRNAQLRAGAARPGTNTGAIWYYLAN